MVDIHRGRVPGTIVLYFYNSESQAPQAKSKPNAGLLHLLASYNVVLISYSSLVCLLQFSHSFLMRPCKEACFRELADTAAL